MPLSKSRQVGDKEQIKEELDCQTPFVSLKDGVPKEGLFVLSIAHGTRR